MSEVQHLLTENALKIIDQGVIDSQLRSGVTLGTIEALAKQHQAAVAKQEQKRKRAARKRERQARKNNRRR